MAYKTRMGRQEDVISIMELGYLVDTEILRTFIENSLAEHCVFVMFDNLRMIGAILFSLESNEAEIFYLLIAKDYNQQDILERLLNIAYIRTPDLVAISVPEEDLERQILLREAGMKCIDTFINDSKEFYRFTKITKPKKEHGIVLRDER